MGFWAVFWGFAVLATCGVCFYSRHLGLKISSLLLFLSWGLWNVMFLSIGKDTTVSIFPPVDLALLYIHYLLWPRWPERWLWIVMALFVIMLTGHVAYSGYIPFAELDRSKFLLYLNLAFGLQLGTLITAGVHFALRNGGYFNSRRVPDNRRQNHKLHNGS